MTLCDAVNDFRAKVTFNSRPTRYCTFAPPEETAGVIDLSYSGDGSRGIAFLADRLVVKLETDARQVYYRDIRVTEILPSYETPFEDELVISSRGGDIRISDCSLNKFFLRQLISTVCRMSNTMKESDREALSQQLTAEAMEYFAGTAERERVPVPIGAAAAVQEIAAAKKAALAEAKPNNPINISEEKIEWLSGKRTERRSSAERQSPAEQENAEKAERPGKSEQVGQSEQIERIERVEQPERPEQRSEQAERVEPEKLKRPVGSASDEPEEPLEDMTREQTMSYLLDSIAEINSEVPEEEPAPAVKAEPASPAEVRPVEAAVDAPAAPVNAPVIPEVREASENVPVPSAPALTREPDSHDIYIQASRKIRELCEDGRLTMAQVDSAVREQLVGASEIYSGLDPENSALPPAVKKRAAQLEAAADRLTDYFALGEDIAARVMFFMLYQMLSYSDRILQTDESKQRLNYFFVRFGAAGMILSMLDANN